MNSLICFQNSVYFADITQKIHFLKHLGENDMVCTIHLHNYCVKLSKHHFCYLRCIPSYSFGCGLYRCPKRHLLIHS